MKYKGNELADQAAKEAAVPTGPVTNYKHVKVIIKSTAQKKWQWPWDISPTGRVVQNIIPEIPTVKYRSDLV